ncbi:MAG: alpha/beta hydrolase [Myxococcales bacterium]|nr:alpha/beta hydrolase [Myxococcales bacterium]
MSTPEDIEALLDHPVIAERYFFPRRAHLADPFIVDRDGVELHCARLEANSDGPTLLHFHGNGEVVGDWLEDFGGALKAEGIGSVFGEYRGYGGSTGTPRLGAQLDDALAIARANGVDPSKMIVYGRSVGSIYALHVAANLPVAGLVIESGIADVLERLALRVRPAELGTDDAGLLAAIAAHLDHRSKMQSTSCPVQIFHARGDDLVPPYHAQRLAEWAGERGSLRLFERGDHNTIHWANGPALMSELVAFCKRCVPSPGANP